MTDYSLENDLEQANAALRDLQAHRKKLNEDLSWYKNTRPSALKETIQALVAKQKGYETERQKVISQLEENQNIIKHQPIKSIFSLAYWIDTDQINLRRERNSILQSEKELRDRLRDIDRLLDDICEQIHSNTDELQRYNTFKRGECERNISDISVAILKKEKEVGAIIRRKNLGELERKRDRAQWYQSRLGSASNNYERAMIHEECKAEFGDGSPGRLVSKFENQINRKKSN